MVLGFMKRFPDGTETNFKEKIIHQVWDLGVEPPLFIKSETPKLHTIRTDSKKRWKAGIRIHFCTGVRTKQMDYFAFGVCKSVQEVRMTFFDNENRIPCIVEIDRKVLEDDDIDKLAINDGFISTDDFLNYFRTSAEEMEEHYPVYRGRLIHWTDLKY